jgi:hypothetical protein
MKDNLKTNISNLLCSIVDDELWFAITKGEKDNEVMIAVCNSDKSIVKSYMFDIDMHTLDNIFDGIEKLRHEVRTIDKRQQKKSGSATA